MPRPSPTPCAASTLTTSWVVVGHSLGGKTAMLLALQHPELVSRLVVVDIAPKSYGSLERFSGYIEEMQRLPLGELTNRADAEARFEEPNAGVKAFLLQNLRRDGDSWRWQANLELFAADAATGTGSVIAEWPESAAAARPVHRAGPVDRRLGLALHHRRGPAGRCGRCSPRCAS